MSTLGGRKLCVAPMMAWTDRHCRYLLRLASPNALLFTEMIAASAVLHAKPDRLLSFHPAEHPLALQLGGSDPEQLAAAARLATQHGFDEINLNVGCPSPRVKKARFGACLMLEPELVARAVEAMRQATHPDRPRPSQRTDKWSRLMQKPQKTSQHGHNRTLRTKRT